MTDLKGNLSTIVTVNDIKDAIWDSCGVLYSKDGKRLLKCENKNLRQYDIKEGTEVICDKAFYTLENLEELSIPNGVTKIGDGAFAWCKNLGKILIPTSVEELGVDAFFCCERLTIGVVEDNGSFCIKGGILFSKGMDTLIRFPDYPIFTYKIPKGVKRIGSKAFCCCSRLTKITIPNGVTSIGYGAFSGCKNLTEVNIPNTMTEIEDRAFSGAIIYMG